jgi:chemotaxis protein CheZ
MGHSDGFSLHNGDAAGNENTGLNAQAKPADEANGSAPTEDIYHRIGHLTRTLHDAMRELGYQESLSDARDNLPDARDRLAYIARLTGDAAEKVLNSVDRARTVQGEITARAQGLRDRWAAVAVYTSGAAAPAGAAAERATPAGAALVDETCAFLASLDSQADLTNGILTDIMMAQDFHDLTGQVIRKVVALATTLEEQLVKLLIDATPVEQRKKVDPVILEGPVVNPENRTDVVSDQAGVDDLLASLGF